MLEKIDVRQLAAVTGGFFDGNYCGESGNRWLPIGPHFRANPFATIGFTDSDACVGAYKERYGIR